MMEKGLVLMNEEERQPNEPERSSQYLAKEQFSLFMKNLKRQRDL